jgi:hypothetical protein
MPWYDYICPIHGQYEVDQRMSDFHEGKCDLCKRIWHSTGIGGDLPTLGTNQDKDKEE